MSKVLVPYSMSFVNAEQATAWGVRQVHLLKKFGVPAYVIRQGKSYLVAREEAEFDNEPVFYTHKDNRGIFGLISLNEVNEKAERLGRKTRFKISHYKIVSELI